MAERTTRTNTFLALLCACIFAVVSCSSPDPWQPRENLRGIQEDGGAKTGAGGQAEAKSGPGGASVDKREIALVIPLTGPLSSFGRCVEDGVRMAFDEEKGERPLLLVIDDKGTPEGAEAAFAKLGARESVLAAIGPVTSSSATRAAAVAEESGLAMMTPSATAFGVTRGRKYSFRACYTSPLQGAALAIFASRYLRARTAAIVTLSGDDYGVSLADAFEAGFSGLGGEVRFKCPLDAQAGPESCVAVLRASTPHPDAILIAAWFEDSSKFMAAAREAGYEGRFIGGDSWHCEDAGAYASDAVQGAFFVTHFTADEPSSAAAAFVEKFGKYAGRTPGPFEALGYDSARMILAAVFAAAPKTRVAVRNALASTKGFMGATGRITLDEDGNPVKPAVIARITAEGPVFEERITFQPGVR